MHRQNHEIDQNPLLKALAAEYARRIKEVKENQEAAIVQLYSEFRHKYQCLKQIIEAQEGNSADRLTSSNAAPPDRLSCKSTD